MTTTDWHQRRSRLLRSWPVESGISTSVDYDSPRLGTITLETLGRMAGLKGHKETANPPLDRGESTDQPTIVESHSPQNKRTFLPHHISSPTIGASLAPSDIKVNLFQALPPPRTPPTDRLPFMKYLLPVLTLGLLAATALAAD